MRLVGENPVDVILLKDRNARPKRNGGHGWASPGEACPYTVIVITGYATVELAGEAMKKGAYDFIAKPFTPEQLQLVVKRALERRALLQQAEAPKKGKRKDL